jgi:xanthine dehydrogenase accessory factor
MNDTIKIWDTIQCWLGQQQLYLLTVIESHGSAPGRRGFKMVVAADGSLFGSIGGGIMEYNMVEKARLMLQSDSRNSIVIKQIHHGSAQNSSGMICSGSQLIAFTPLSNQDLPMIANKSANCQMLEINQQGLYFAETRTKPSSYYKSDEDWHYSEWWHNQLIAHIFGAGHVSLPTSELLVKLGFKVFLYDNRLDINTYADNDIVYAKKVIDYNDIEASININKDDYVLLMTHKFVEDRLLLTQLLKNQYKYLGVLGSDNKIKVMNSALLDLGCSQAQLDRVFAPIGLPIKSQSVDEIAVSIVAEIIAVKNK